MFARVTLPFVGENDVQIQLRGRTNGETRWRGDESRRLCSNAENDKRSKIPISICPVVEILISQIPSQFQEFFLDPSSSAALEFQDGDPAVVGVIIRRDIPQCSAQLNSLIVVSRVRNTLVDRFIV